jgi:hypothetical protein
MSSFSQETSFIMRDTVDHSAEARSILITPLTGAIINHAAFPKPPGLDPTLEQDPIPTHHWACTPYAFTSICSDGVPLHGKAYNQQQ